MSSPSLQYLNTCSLVYSTVEVDLGGVTLREEVCRWWQALRGKSLAYFCFALSASRWQFKTCALSFCSVGSCLPTVMDSHPSEIVKSKETLLLICLIVLSPDVAEGAPGLPVVVYPTLL